MNENKKTKIAIANRGEVAVRIARACKELGYTSVLLHSEPDIKSKAYRICNETELIGAGPSAESYISIENTIQGILRSGAKAVHPGFGFLSENADFARACQKNNILFIGPQPESMDLFGDKISAKNFCEEQDVPTLQSYRGDDQSLPTLLKEAEKVKYPVLIKATAGGGGRGMRVVNKKEEFEGALDSAKNEALKAFGSDKVFLEKYLPSSKHIEVQIFGTKKETFILGERECSVQRRHQKIIEEALSPSLNKEQRERVYGYAKKLASSSNYLGAGTVEFLFKDDQFYFLEVNTRLQVEHPVTEEVFGVDLVQAQIKTAFEQDISWKQENFNSIKNPEHSIECRIYAENLEGFPYVGKIGSVLFGHEQEEVNSSRRMRIESGFERDDEISPFYDSMIAKVICTAKNRETAISELIHYFESTYITGIQTNIPLLIEILKHKEFTSAKMETNFFENNFKDGLKPKFTEEDIIKIAKQSLQQSETKSLFANKWRPSL